ncbi:FAD-dependent oxidoreductase [Candidatus Peregrinibacteria bacterium]|jgi:thioredoxin-disulfide reductase|nr:FAD-dependent oxidoreductase [Candidatus Peregrinibacteria bacterium]MBT4632291.1 FAD-dependent oxidoreductase [Candidatus Peregrinibacteria bacterium]MBT5516875.1 FAD-dependent oxidoreductase [Candidatus Peregrinibacteria bacterium]MBT5824298.1 FAD-dependent oxidoreductase [Candidatus Peregrinibacteria bacterium]
MIHDLIIIGGGCAGLASSIYARRYNMNVLILTEALGGTITLTHLVENYPGFTSVSGQELADAFIAHAKANDVEMKVGNRVSRVWKEGETFKIAYGKEEVYETHTVLLATGTTYRKLGIPGEEEFSAKGVSYCATCDAGFFKGKNTIMVGGGDSAVKESLILAEHAAKVTIIYRKDKFTKAEPINITRMEKTENIDVKFNTNLTEVLGDNVVTGVKLDNGEEMATDGVFIEIGRIPLTSMIDEIGVEKNDKGEIIINKMSETNVPGFYAAGDVTAAEWKQAIVSAAEGTKAAYKAYEYVSAKKA